MTVRLVEMVDDPQIEMPALGVMAEGNDRTARYGIALFRQERPTCKIDL